MKYLSLIFIVTIIFIIHVENSVGGILLSFVIDLYFGTDSLGIFHQIFTHIHLAHRMLRTQEKAPAWEILIVVIVVIIPAHSA